MMIRINLLPDEFRRNDRGSPKVLAAVVAAVICVSATLGWFGMVYFGDLAKLQAEHQQVAEDLARKSQGAAYFDQLQRQSKDYSQRVDTIQSIGKSRRLWTEFLDQAVDVTSNNTDLDRHLSWFTGVTIRDGNGAKGPVVTLPGAVQGREMAKVANLHKDIASAPFFNDIRAKSPPGGQVQFAKDRIPEESFGFSMTLEFKPPTEWQKNVNQPAGAKARKK